MKASYIPNFNMNKLPEYVGTELVGKNVLLIGGGAVGSHAASAITQQGVGQLTIIDKDRFETSNIAKSSFVYDPVGDDGRNKAIALSERINHRLGAPLTHGIDTDISNLGPRVLVEFDVIILALDNYGAKVLVNHQWLQIPEEKRPLLIFGGTDGASSQCNCLDGTEVCLRCMLDESWLDNPFESYSCTGINYGGETSSYSESDRTTGGASLISAALMAEDCVGYLLGNKGMINKRTFYNSYPHQGFFKYVPMKRKSCPDCKNYHSIKEMTCLKDMDVLHTTVEELLGAIKEYMPDDNFEIFPQSYEPGKVIYNKIIKDDYCRCCGKEMKKLYRHEYKTKVSDLICYECRATGKSIDDKYKGLAGSFIGAIRSDNCDEILAQKTLFEVGFPLGALIKVRHQIDGASFLDSSFEDYWFYCENDLKVLKTIDKLEG